MAKVYRSQLTTFQKSQYDILKSRGFNISPSDIRNLTKAITLANRVISKFQKQLGAYNKLSKNIAHFIKDEKDFKKLRYKIDVRLHETGETAMRRAEDMKANLVKNVTMLFGNDLGLSNLTPQEIKNLMEDPAYARFKAFAYGEYPDEESVNAPVVKNAEMVLFWQQSKGDMQDVIADIASYHKGG